MQHRRSDSGVNSQIEEPDQLPIVAPGSSLLAGGPSVIKYNVCLHCRQTLYFITLRIRAATQTVASDVNEINSCGPGPHELISLTSSCVARTEDLASFQYRQQNVS